MRLFDLLGKPVVRRERVIPVGPSFTAMLDDDADAKLADSEAQGRLARTVERLERLAHELEARYVRYAWTEQLAAELRAIAHDTPTMGG